MSLYVLDTDHVSLFQRGHPQVTGHVLTHLPARLAVTIVTVEEQLRGRLSQIRKAASGTSRVQGYRRLREALEFFSQIRILDFDEGAHLRYEGLRQQKVRIGTQDLCIAAIVLAVNGVLVTRNVRDFAQVSGLTIEDWSQA